MHTSTLFFSLLALAATARSLKFTGPSTSSPLDFSKEITITWSESNSSEHKSRPTFDLEWFSQPTDLKSFGFEIETGVNISAGQYKFTPSSNTINTLRPFANQLSENETFLFKAIFRNESDKSDMVYEASSGKYAVVGLDKVTNAGKAVGLEWGVLACGLAAASFFMI
ncbi:hypothetical protein FOYG_15106 [Fusarium oxysporum NRRL 32931]|uniref:Uncharacterized protein n=1 Tax=Fusarium oxysporum NRRL 32931 TaxID=660029 RepID=W9HS31_FUSOX|nr:hypothetical protein FOYG_15106 [Fusarium oxysporum NRRL 32931]